MDWSSVVLVGIGAGGPLLGLMLGTWLRGAAHEQAERRHEAERRLDSMRIDALSAVADERAGLLREAQELLDAQARGTEDSSAALAGLRDALGSLPADAGPADRVAAVGRLLRAAREARAGRDRGRAPAGPAPGAPPPAGDGRGPDPVV